MTQQEQNDRIQEFRNLGFRCIESTKINFLDGSIVTVKASDYLESEEKKNIKENKNLTVTDQQKSTWRIYAVNRENHQSMELIDELQLEKRMGAAFNNLK